MYEKEGGNPWLLGLISETPASSDLFDGLTAIFGSCRNSSLGAH